MRVMESPSTQHELFPNRPDSERTHADALAAAAPSAMLDKGGANGNDQYVIADSNSSVWLSSGKAKIEDRRLREWKKRKSWNQKLVNYSMLQWMGEGLLLVWLTLTSSLSSDPKLLRYNFKKFRYRIEAEHGWPKNSIKYRCVETLEGNGVLHIVLALPCAPKSLWVDFKAMHSWWMELHGAKQFKWVEVGGAMIDAKKLSVYILAQYVGNQDAIVRFSGSRQTLNFKRIARQVKDIVFGWGSAKYQQAEAAFLHEFTGQDVFNKNPALLAAYRDWQRHLWNVHRKAVEELVYAGSAEVWGRLYVRIHNDIFTSEEV
ncbi:MAG: hypothetical protein WA435_02785 [Gallionellaceae bacterium]